MKISVVVPAFNEERLLPASLQHIKESSIEFDKRGWQTELIVCDNNSTDRTAEIAREAGADVVFEPVNQISRARNTGAASASGDWLIFVDADSFPSPELFDDVATAIEAGVCLGGGSTVRLESDRLDVRLWVAAWNALSRRARWAAGSFVFCEAAAFRELGGFSETLYAGEEIELSRRLKRLAGRKHRSVVILHRHPLRSSARKVRLYSSGELFLFLLRTIACGGRTLRSRDACFAWYDGRR
jgi:glycosyltransferase involved in cell wall biosynthesis